MEGKWEPKAKRHCVDPSASWDFEFYKVDDDDENNYEGDEVCFISAHLDPHAIIWSEDPEQVPLHEGKFLVGWDIDINQGPEDKHPKETMFLIENVVPMSSNVDDWKEQVG